MAEKERLSEKAYNRKKEYNISYIKDSCYRFQIDFSKATCKDIIKHLENLDEPKATYIKRLIRDDIAKQKKKRGQK